MELLGWGVSETAMDGAPQPLPYCEPYRIVSPEARTSLFYQKVSGTGATNLLSHRHADATI